MLFFKKKKIRFPDTLPATVKQSPGSNYERILTAIEKQNGRSTCFLLAASSLDELPVTVPVNLAIRMARTHSCLLIDLDMRRDAVARVFDIPAETDNHKTVSYSTPIENLSIWPARNFERLRHMNLRLLVENAAKKYDYVLIYAPYLTTLPDRRQAAACAHHVFAFTGSNGTALLELLTQCNCKVQKM